MTDNVLTRMQTQADAWQTAGDRRAIFLQCYQMMTANVLVAVDNGRFHDGPWVTQLLHRFADYYFDALALYDAQRPCSGVWQQAFSACGRKRVNVLQHLFLGVNAHINYDLVLTLVDLLQPEWATLDADARRRRYEDHTLVNDIIADTIDAVQDEVVERHSPLLKLVDWLAGPVDEFIVAELISHWRQEVWDTAVAMLETADPAAHDAMRQRLEQRVLRRGEQILGLGGD